MKTLYALAISVLLLASCQKYKEVSYQVKIIEKVYQPRTDTTHVGYSFAGDGGFVVGGNVSPEKWLLIIQDGEETKAHEVDAQTWAKAQVGGDFTLTKHVIDESQ